MTQEERRIWLIQALWQEMDSRYRGDIPTDAEGQWRLLRALFNIRQPAPASPEFLSIEGEFLEEMTRQKGIVAADELPACDTDSRLVLWRGDITRLDADAIVNAANSQLLGCFRPNHSCIDNLEQTMAGVEMRYACWQLMQQQGHEEPPGQAKITKAYHLPSRYVIHTVGPIVRGTLTETGRQQLASCYRACLDAAEAYGLRNIAFCCIATGVFGFPRAEAASIAVRTVRNWLDHHESASVKQVIFDVYTREDEALYTTILQRLPIQ